MNLITVLKSFNNVLIPRQRDTIYIFYHDMDHEWLATD